MEMRRPYIRNCAAGRRGATLNELVPLSAGSALPMHQHQRAALDRGRDRPMRTRHEEFTHNITETPVFRGQNLQGLHGDQVAVANAMRTQDTTQVRTHLPQGAFSSPARPHELYLLSKKKNQDLRASRGHLARSGTSDDISRRFHATMDEFLQNPHGVRVNARLGSRGVDSLGLRTHIPEPIRKHKDFQQELSIRARPRNRGEIAHPLLSDALAQDALVSSRAALPGVDYQGAHEVGRASVYTMGARKSAVPLPH